MTSTSLHKARSRLPSRKLGTSGTAAQPSIVFTNPERDQRHVSGWTLSVLEACMVRAGVRRLYITSTYRSPLAQARVMHGNITPGKTMYANYGHRVEDVARKIVLMDQAVAAVAEAISKLPGVTPVGYHVHSTEEIVSEMAVQIERLEQQHGQGCVSRHQLDPARTNVVDIGSRTVTPQSALGAFIAELTASTRVQRIGLPKGSKGTHGKHFVETQPCLHLEIAQPVDAPLANRFEGFA